MTLRQEKAVVFVSLSVIVSALYLGTAHSGAFDAVAMPATAFDRWIPFLPDFVFVYFSLFALIPLPLFLFSRPEDLRAGVTGFCLIVVVSCATFAFWPTRIPAGESTPLLRGLLALDTGSNASPSLHASLAIYCALWARRSIRSELARFGVILWAAVVVASALLIKRHVVVDIAAGAAIGWLVYRLMSRPSPVEAPDTAPVLETLRIRRRLQEQAPDEIGAILRHDPRARLTELAVFVGLAAVGLSLSLLGLSPISPVVLAAGIATTALALNSFVLLMHEGMHGALFRNPWWNWFVSYLLGMTFLMSFSSYRVMHIRHHRYLGDPRDPDDYKNYSSNPLVVWGLHFVRLTLGSLLYLFLIPALALKYGSRAERKRICFEYVGMFTLYSALLRTVPTSTLFTVWIVPLLLVGTMTAIRGFAQHGITEAADPYLASRTMQPHPVVRFFLLNENYHLEHHLFPEAPSYNLDRLHRLIWPKLPRAVAGDSYLGFLLDFLRATPRMDETPIGFVKPREARQ